MDTLFKIFAFCNVVANVGVNGNLDLVMFINKQHNVVGDNILNFVFPTYLNSCMLLK